MTCHRYSCKPAGYRYVLATLGGTTVLATLGGSAAVTDAATALLVTVAIVITLAVLGLLGLLIWRLRSELTNVPATGITRERVHAEVIEPTRVICRPNAVPETSVRALPSGQ